MDEVDRILAAWGIETPELDVTPLRVLSRKASASPATGSTKKHQAEQAELVAAAFTR